MRGIGWGKKPLRREWGRRGDVLGESTHEINPRTLSVLWHDLSVIWGKTYHDKVIRRCSFIIASYPPRISIISPNASRCFAHSPPVKLPSSA
jgi:hypothetical protein